MRKTELAEIKQNLWRKYRDNGKEFLAPTRARGVPKEGKLERKDHQQTYPSVADCFSSKREEKIKRASQLEDHWELMKVCVKYIEENEEWLITSRLERSHQEEERQKLWEKEERLDRMSKRKEIRRETKDKTETRHGILYNSSASKSRQSTGFRKI